MAQAQHGSIKLDRTARLATSKGSRNQDKDKQVAWEPYRSMTCYIYEQEWHKKQVYSRNNLVSTGIKHNFGIFFKATFFFFSIFFFFFMLCNSNRK